MVDEKDKLTVRLPSGQKEDLRRVAWSMGVSMNAVVALAVRDYVARYDRKAMKVGG